MGNGRNGARNNNNLGKRCQELPHARSAFAGTGACNHSFVPAAEKSLRSYDARNRLTYIDHPPGTADVSYSYYADGAPWTVASSDGGTWSYSYNKRRLLTGESLNIDGLTFGFTRHYDQHGHPASLVYPDGAAINYWPNALGQPTRVANYAHAITYHPNGSVAGFNLGIGGLHIQTLNARQLPLRRREIKGSHSYLDYNYTYDRNGNVSGLLDNRPGGIETRYMEYDPVDRLTEATAPEMLGAEYFTYDPLDNLRSLTYPGRANLLIQYEYLEKNRLTKIKLTAGHKELEHFYSYDARGNMTSGLTPGPGHVDREQSFDKANRMITAITSGQTESFRYDGHGRRTKILRGGGNTYQVYTRDGRFVLERAPNGTFTRHIHLGNRLLVSVTGSTPTYQHTDHLGSIVRKSNAAGNETQTTSYAPYGSIQNGTLTQGPGFTGHVSDQASGLSYMQQRYHDPLAMRFVSVDPVLPSTSDGGNFNRYWYANNNPYKFVDPDGREAGFRYEPGGMRNHFTDNHVDFSGAAGALDFIPIVGDIKGAVEAIQEPSLVNVVAAAVGIVPGIGDAAGKMIKGADNLASGGKRFSSEKEALVDMAQADAKVGVTRADMATYQELNHNLPDPFPSNKVRVDEGHPGRSTHSQQPHGHVGPVDHIPIKDK